MDLVIITRIILIIINYLLFLQQKDLDEDKAKSDFNIYFVVFQNTPKFALKQKCFLRKYLIFRMGKGVLGDLLVQIGQKRRTPTLEPMKRSKRRRTMVELPLIDKLRATNRARDDISLRHVTNALVKSDKENRPLAAQEHQRTRETLEK